MKKRAQAAIEYLLVGAMVTLVILPTVYIFYAYSHTSNEEVKQSQLNKVGTDIVDIAEQVYYLGEPSKVTLDAAMPEGIIGIEVWRNQEVVFFLNDGSEVAFMSKVNITTNQNCIGRCYGNFTKTFHSPGLKSIIIEAKEDHVFIREAGDNQTEQAEIEEELIYCDEDDDTYYSIAGFYSCPSGRNQTTPGNDCNDSDYYINIGVAEKCDDSLDNDCDGSTDAWDSDCFECTPLTETRPCSKQMGICSGSFETCNGGGTWPGCDYGPDYESPETSCDGLDNDCDGSTDEDLTAPAANKQDGVCAGSTKVCDGINGWIEPDYYQITGYEEPETSCDGLDNDCGGTVDEEDDMISPLNSKQDGVCAGSTQSCIAGSWQDDYSEVANYETKEVTCYDNEDNDCNILIDCDDDCLGKICDEAGTKICIDGPYGIECAPI